MTKAQTERDAYWTCLCDHLMEEHTQTAPHDDMACTFCDCPDFCPPERADEIVDAIYEWALEDGERWAAGLWWPATKDEPERKAVLLAEVSMEMAQGVAEDYVRRNGVAVLSDANAAWRRKPPSDRAVSAAKRWRMKDVERFKTAGELSDALDAHIARVKAKPRRKVTA